MKYQAGDFRARWQFSALVPQSLSGTSYCSKSREGVIRYSNFGFQSIGDTNGLKQIRGHEVVEITKEKSKKKFECIIDTVPPGVEVGQMQKKKKTCKPKCLERNHAQEATQKKKFTQDIQGANSASERQSHECGIQFAYTPP